MVNNSLNSSNKTRGINIMNLRFWGGWFLTIACVCIFLTMGCGEGVLGVKSAVVTGRVLDKSNRQPVENVTVRMVSKESVGSGELPQGYNFLNTKTDAQGYFLFEKVNPDNVVLAFEAAGYKQIIFPSSESDSEEDGEAIDIESVSIRSGGMVDLAEILMEKVSVTLPSKVNVKLEFVDASTNERVDDNQYFTVSFDGNSCTQKAKSWRESGYDVVAANEIKVSVRNESEPVLYETCTLDIVGSSDVYEKVSLTPVTYTLVFQFQNIPAYITNSSKTPEMYLMVEDTSDATVPAKHVAAHRVADFSKLATIEVPAVKNPQQVRIRMVGYEDEIVNLSGALGPGERATYRIDVDFDSDVAFSSSGGVVGLKDNVRKKDVVFCLLGLTNVHRAKIYINLPSKVIQWARPVSGSPDSGGLADDEGSIRGTFKEVPTGFDLTYTCQIRNPSTGNVYVIESVKPVYIEEPTADDTKQLISFDATSKGSSL